jgi:hypothetical protein
MGRGKRKEMSCGLQSETIVISVMIKGDGTNTNPLVPFEMEPTYSSSKQDANINGHCTVNLFKDLNSSK